MQVKVYLESHRGRRSEPAELCGLRRQVTEAKEGLLELRRKKSKHVQGKQRGKGVCPCCILHDKGFYLFPNVGLKKLKKNLFFFQHLQ